MYNEESLQLYMLLKTANLGNGFESLQSLYFNFEANAEDFFTYFN